MMVLAATVSALVAALGIRGLADSNESLRTVYEERMTPVRTLSQIAHLMLANQHQLQMALAPFPAAGSPVRAALQPESARRAAQAMEDNMHAIDRLWENYVATLEKTEKIEQVERFATRRTGYRNEAIKPAIAALRSLDYADTQRLTGFARTLYERDSPDIQALIDLQFEQARSAYRAGLHR